MIEEIKNINTKKSEIRKFGISIGIALMILAGFLFWRGRESYEVLLITGLALSVLGLILPVILKPIYWVWMLLAIILGWIMTRVILSLLFYLVITPIGVFSRLFGKSFLDLKWNTPAETYWNIRSTKQLNTKDYENQF